MVSSLVAGLVLALGQDVRRDIQLPVMSIKSLGHWLGEQTGREVKVDRRVEDRLVYIHLNNRTLKEMLQFVREAVEVETHDLVDRIELRPVADPNTNGFDHSSLWKEEIREYPNEGELESAIREIDEVLKGFGPNGEGGDFVKLARVQDKYSAFEVLSQIGYRVLSRLGNREINRLPLDERIVFSSDPTRLQRQWPGDWKSDLASFNEGTENASNARATVGIKQRGGMQVQLKFMQPDRLNRGDAVAIRMELTRKSDYLICELTVYDSGGIQLESNRLGAQFITYGGGVGESKEERERRRKYLESIDETVVLTEQNLAELGRLRLLAFGGNDSKVISPEDQLWLRSVDEQEPYAGILTTLWDRVCRKAEKEIVVEISPRTFVPSDNLSELKKYSSILFSSIPIEKLEATNSDVLTGSPIKSRDSWLVSRKVLAFLARRAGEEWLLDIDDFADALPLLASEVQIGTVFQTGLTMTGQRSENDSYDTEGWAGLGFLIYAHLTEDEKAEVRSEKGLEWNMSTSAGPVRDRVMQMIRTNRIGSLHKWVPSGGGHSLEVPEGWPGSIPYTNWNNEVTTLLIFPEFSPIYLRLGFKSGSSVLRKYFNGVGTSIQRSSASSIGTMLAEEEYAEPGSLASRSRGLGWAEYSALELEIRFGKTELIPAPLSIFKTSVTKPMELKDLPEAIRSEVVKAYEKRREEMSRQSGGGGRVPPPERLLWLVR